MPVNCGVLVYPVLTLTKHGEIELCIDELTMTTSTSRELKGGMFDGMRIIDSDGKTYVVEDARYISGRGSIFGYGMLFLTRVIQLELTIDDNVTQVNLDELKKIIAKDIRKWGGFMDPVTLRYDISAVNKASTYKELFDISSKHIIDRKHVIEDRKPSLKRRENH